VSQPLALRLREARERSGLTQDQVARELGATRQQIINWEKGRNVPRPERRRQLEAVYGLQAGALEPLEVLDEEILLLRQVLETVERLLALHERRASSPGGGSGGHAEQVAKEPWY
jgi:transcriptional regulator with XRE-family HTH domain